MPRALLLIVLLVGCGPVGARDVDGPRRPDGRPGAPVDALAALAAPRATRLVVVERGAQGSRLVMVDEEGLRQRVLTESDAARPTLDLMPAWSPDGRWIVFASTRDREGPSGERFSLWIISALEPDAAPARLTRDAAVDWTPTWTPDGGAIVFASTGDSGSFDLYRLELDGASGEPPRPGSLTRLTRSELEEKDPDVSPDGKRLAYTAIDGRVPRLMVADIDGGHERELVEGGAEPAWSPDGTWLAYVAPTVARDDLDVWRIDAGGRGRALVLDDDVGDEHAPRFSADGCFVFATSLLRNQMTKVVTSTLVVTPRCGKKPARDDARRWQALVEVHPTARMGFDVAPVAMRADVLGRAPDYRAALRRALAPRDDDAPDTAPPDSDD